MARRGKCEALAAVVRLGFAGTRRALNREWAGDKRIKMDKTHYRTCSVDGVDIFYREGGSPDDPVVLLLHGWPSSSRMFEKLIATLSDRYHLIAPDYPAFGHSDTPDRKTFAYTFDNFSDIIEHFKIGRASCRERVCLYV